MCSAQQGKIVIRLSNIPTATHNDKAQLSQTPPDLSMGASCLGSKNSEYSVPSRNSEFSSEQYEIESIEIPVGRCRDNIQFEEPMHSDLQRNNKNSHHREYFLNNSNGTGSQSAESPPVSTVHVTNCNHRHLFSSNQNNNEISSIPTSQVYLNSPKVTLTLPVDAISYSSATTDTLSVQYGSSDVQEDHQAHQTHQNYWTFMCTEATKKVQKVLCLLSPSRLKKRNHRKRQIHQHPYSKHNLLNKKINTKQYSSKTAFTSCSSLGLSSTEPSNKLASRKTDTHLQRPTYHDQLQTKDQGNVDDVAQMAMLQLICRVSQLEKKVDTMNNNLITNNFVPTEDENTESDSLQNEISPQNSNQNKVCCICFSPSDEFREQQDSTTEYMPREEIVFQKQHYHQTNRKYELQSNVFNDSGVVTRNKNQNLSLQRGRQKESFCLETDASILQRKHVPNLETLHESMEPAVGKETLDGCHQRAENIHILKEFECKKEMIKKNGLIKNKSLRTWPLAEPTNVIDLYQELGHNSLRQKVPTDTKYQEKDERSLLDMYPTRDQTTTTYQNVQESMNLNSCKNKQVQTSPYSTNNSCIALVSSDYAYGKMFGNINKTSIKLEKKPKPPDALHIEPPNFTPSRKLSTKENFQPLSEIREDKPSNATNLNIAHRESNGQPRDEIERIPPLPLPKGTHSLQERLQNRKDNSCQTETLQEISYLHRTSYWPSESTYAENIYLKNELERQKKEIQHMKHILKLNTKHFKSHHYQLTCSDTSSTKNQKTFSKIKQVRKRIKNRPASKIINEDYAELEKDDATLTVGKPNTCIRTLSHGVQNPIADNKIKNRKATFVTVSKANPPICSHLSLEKQSTGEDVFQLPSMSNNEKLKETDFDTQQNGIWSAPTNIWRSTVQRAYACANSINRFFSQLFFFEDDNQSQQEQYSQPRMYTDTKIVQTTLSQSSVILSDPEIRSSSDIHHLKISSHKNTSVKNKYRRFHFLVCCSHGGGDSSC